MADYLIVNFSKQNAQSKEMNRYYDYQDNLEK